MDYNSFLFSGKFIVIHIRLILYDPRAYLFCILLSYSSLQYIVLFFSAPAKFIFDTGIAKRLSRSGLSF